MYLNALVNIGISYKNEKKYENAIEYFARAGILDPKDEAINLNHGICLVFLLQNKSTDHFKAVAKERIEKAQSLFATVLEVNPKQERARIETTRLTYLLKDKTLS